MVAERAGVSPSTVSRILNGTAVVSDEKRAAVDRAIAALGFVPNPVARGLAGGRTLSIGVVTQAIDSPFYGSALRGIESELSDAGYSPLFMSGHWRGDLEARCIEILRARRVDGLIVLTGRLSDAALRSVAFRMSHRAVWLCAQRYPPPGTSVAGITAPCSTRSPLGRCARPAHRNRISESMNTQRFAAGRPRTRVFA